ncbi:MAG: ECF transporter S component [Clostridia bacterium]|nr:ECF transporter S component [Clostridia bacterium]
MKNRNQSQSNLFRLVFAGVTGAMVCIATSVFVIPLPTGGYVNLGDCFVMIAGYLLGAVYGAFAGGIGSALADLFLGYSIYAPFTFIIKALMATVVYWIFKFATGHLEKVRFLAMIIATLCAEAIMISGYFLLEICFYGLEGAVANLLGNAVQGLFGCVSTVIFYSFLSKTKLSDKLTNILCSR